MGTRLLFEESQVVEMLRGLVRDSTQKKIAEDAGVSPQHLNDVLNSRRAPVGKILEYLKFEDVGRRYARVEKAVRRGK